MEQKEQSFEEKLALADKILNDLNKDDVSLENSIKLHEQGKKLLNEAREILQKAASRYNLSQRGIKRTLRVARSIADLDDSEQILKPHILEALSFRA